MKIIIIGLNWLGDIIMSIPAISAAAAAGEVHIVTRPHLADVYHLIGLPLQIHAVATNAGPLDAFRQLQPLRKLKADHTLVFPDSFRAACLAKLCNSRQITGFSAQFRSLFLDRAVKKPDNFKVWHESDLHFLLCREAGVASGERPQLPHCGFADEVFNDIARRLEFDPEREFLVMAPGAAFGAAKRWPPCKFRALASMIARNLSIPVIVTAGNSEKSISAEICRDSESEVIDVAGKTSLVDLACLLSRARGLIANDSGTMHLAALYGTPTVVPVGPTDMARTGPLNSSFAAVNAPGACPQAPCRQRTCPRNDHICMESVTPEAVFVELTSLLRKSNAI